MYKSLINYLFKLGKVLKPVWQNQIQFGKSID